MASRRWAWFLLALLPIAGWPIMALLLGAISLNDPPADPGPDGIEITLTSNGWHVDLVLPMQAGGVDWSTDFPAADTAIPFASTYIAIGWGDRDFYLETPRLRDLKFKTAVNALLGRGPTVLHVAHLPGMPEGHRMKIDPATYQALAERLRGSVQRDGAGRTIPIKGRGFSNTDAFYEAKGHYSPITTCNEWLAAHLRAVGLPAGLWSPLPQTLLMHWP
jgi:uncharacterized protein (TIGR02117 family)